MLAKFFASLQKFASVLPWWGIAVWCGIGCGLGFVWPAFSVVSILMIAVSLFWLDHIGTSDHIVAAAFWVFFIKSLVALSWLTNVYPVLLMEGMPPAIQMAALSLYAITAALWLGIGGCVFGSVVKVLHIRKSSVRGRYISYIPLWLGVEVMGSGVFALVTAAPGVVPLPDFSFGYVGYLFASLPGMLSLARFGGVEAIAAVGLMLITSSVLAVVYLDRRAVIVAGGIVMLIVLSATTWRVTSVAPATVAIMNTRFLSVYKNVAYDEVIKNSIATAVSATLTTKPNLIVLPEDVAYLDRVYHADEVGPTAAVEAFRLLEHDPQTRIVDTARTKISDDRFVSRSTVFGGGTSTIYQQDKIYLVPQGEYVPWLYRVGLRAVGYGATVDSLLEYMNYVVGTTSVVVSAPTEIPSVLFCFESVSPYQALRLAAARPHSYIVHPVSHGWFHMPTVLWQQLDMMLRIEAVGAGVPIISAGNLAEGKVYLPDGTTKIGTTTYESALVSVQQVTLP
jgi:apolipoprotein N-acyltransferase